MSLVANAILDQAAVASDVILILFCLYPVAVLVKNIVTGKATYPVLNVAAIATLFALMGLFTWQMVALST